MQALARQARRLGTGSSLHEGVTIMLTESSRGLGSTMPQRDFWDELHDELHTHISHTRAEAPEADKNADGCTECGRPIGETGWFRRHRRAASGRLV